MDRPLASSVEVGGTLAYVAGGGSRRSRAAAPVGCSAVGIGRGRAGVEECGGLSSLRGDVALPLYVSEAEAKAEAEAGASDGVEEVR